MKIQSSFRAVLALGFTASVLALATVSTTRSVTPDTQQLAYRASGRITHMANRGSGRLELIAHRASGRFSSRIG